MTIRMEEKDEEVELAVVAGKSGEFPDQTVGTGAQGGIWNDQTEDQTVGMGSQGGTWNDQSYPTTRFERAEKTCRSVYWSEVGYIFLAVVFCASLALFPMLLPITFCSVIILMCCKGIFDTAFPRGC
jgi:hypothetical protein